MLTLITDEFHMELKMKLNQDICYSRVFLASKGLHCILILYFLNFVSPAIKLLHYLY